MEKKYRLFPWICICLWAMLTLCHWLLPTNMYSDTERRKLQQMPSPSVATIQSGQFMRSYETFAQDQFPFREQFRTGKALFGKYVLGQLTAHDIFVVDGIAAKLDSVYMLNSVLHATDRFEKVYNMYFKDSQASVYVSVIPDKSYYLAANNGYPGMDYKAMTDDVQKEMPYAKYVDLFGVLRIEDYYKTDAHWRQESIQSVANLLGEAMGITLQEEYVQTELPILFSGVYIGQSALPLPKEPIYYMTSPMLEACRVWNYESNRATEIYDLEKAQGKDAYDVFLSGSVSLLSIQNPKATTHRKLILFRDSFGSSLAPYFCEAYEEILLVDLRYIGMQYLEQYISADETTDVLFLYSTSVLNHSETIK